MTSERDVLMVIGLGVMHALWIGVLTAAWAGMSLRLLGTARPAVRQAIAMTALVSMAVAPLLVSIAAVRPAAAWLRWVAVAWAAGAGAGGIRLVNSLRLVQGFRVRARAAGGAWPGRFRTVATALGVTRSVALMESADVETPCSIGIRWPAVLMPLGALGDLSETGFRAIAAHELAHVKRADYAWNLAQRALEAVLFFHPATPWLSGVIGRERERGCDEIASGVCAPLELARGLAEVEARRAAPSARALVSRDQPLLERVQELVHLADAGRDDAGEMHVPVTAMVCASGVALPFCVIWAAGLVPGASAQIAGPWLAAAGLGLLVGLRHAFEPDHLMAVATLVSRERSVGAAARLGASWGVGHTASLLAAGSLLAGLRLAMPIGLATFFEAGVAVMVAGMGLRALRESWRMASGGPSQLHAHGDARHIHPTNGAHVHIGTLTLARRPLVVGVVHGLAGSGALTALAVASLPTLPTQVGFMLVFGVGSAAGMAAVAGVAGWPVARLVRTRLAMALLSAATGTAAVALGVAWGAILVQQLVEG